MTKEEKAMKQAIGYLKWLLPYAACDIQKMNDEKPALNNHLDKIRKFIEENENREYINKENGTSNLNDSFDKRTFEMFREE